MNPSLDATVDRMVETLRAQGVPITYALRVSLDAATRDAFAACPEAIAFDLDVKSHPDHAYAVRVTPLRTTADVRAAALRSRSS